LGYSPPRVVLLGFEVILAGTGWSGIVHSVPVLPRNPPGLGIGPGLGAWDLSLELGFQPAQSVPKLLLANRLSFTKLQTYRRAGLICRRAFARFTKATA
jgi:hypothetical protein